MSDVQNNTVSNCEKEGRQAFLDHGVKGDNRHSYPNGSPQQIGFQTGFSVERNAACERAPFEARDYHALTIRDLPKDRAWAEKLAARA